MWKVSKLAHLIFHYYSTSCLHGHHAYCQKERGVMGQKNPAQCKFCKKPCRCRCHKDESK